MVPDNCKIIKQKTLYKKCKKSNPKNYRPISLLPVFHNPWKGHPWSNYGLCNYKNPFMQISTETCLSYLQDKVAKGFDSGWLTGMIFVDLRFAD